MFLFIPLISCQSSGQKDLPSREMNVPPGEKSGTVGKVALEDRILSLPDENIKIACALDSDSTKSFLEHSDTFSYTGFIRPDGPVRTLLFRNSDALTAWMGDGIRSGMGPDGLKILPADDINSILLKSGNESWTIPAERETMISWQGYKWIVYASNITIGELQDQPPFAADVVILRQ